MTKIRLLYDAYGTPIQGVFFPNTGSEQVVAFNTPFTSAMRVPLNCGLVRVWSDADCHIAFGGSGVTPTTSNLLLKANTPEYFAIGDDPNNYIAIIGSGAGNLYITPMN